jgi:hypothetical protein
MRTLWDHAQQKMLQQPPHPDTIVLRRRGWSDTVEGPVPGGHGEIMDTYDGRWMAKLEYEEKPGDFYVAHEKTDTRPGAIQALKALVAQHTDANPDFEIAPQVEAYGYPKTHEADWYKATVFYTDSAAVTLEGDEVARFEDGAMVTTDDEWREQVQRANEKYQKQHIQRLDESEAWATWLLGHYMREDGAAFEWRQKLTQ